MERDIILERLEKKLAEKEKEVEELKKMLSVNKIEELKREIVKEIKNELKEIEAKLTELSKTVETLMSEVLYLKSELKKSGKRDIVEINVKGDRDKRVDEDIIVVE